MAKIKNAEQAEEAHIALVEYYSAIIRSAFARHGRAELARQLGRGRDIHSTLARGEYAPIRKLALQILARKLNV